MKFDFCIGNPPYQEITESDSTRMMPVYHMFMEEAYKVAGKVELITPARFLFNAGYTPKDWNKKMLNDPHFKIEKYESISDNIFAGKDIKGGIVISYRDDNRDFEIIGNFIKDQELRTILSKVKKTFNGSISDISYSALSYKFTDNVKKDFPELPFRFRTNAFETHHEMFLTDDPKDDEYMEIVGLNKGERTHRFVKKKYIRTPDNFEKYKIFLPKSNGSGALGEVLSTPMIGHPMIGHPMIGHTQTFMSIGAFDDERTADNCMKYIKTKFARCLLGVLKITQDNPPRTWAKVPLQDFTSSSDIDWSQTIPEIDQQLYKKYGLSPEEIDFIEEKVKEMT